MLNLASKIIKAIKSNKGIIAGNTFFHVNVLEEI